MFPLIGSLLVAAAGHLLGKAAGKAWDAQGKRDTAAAGAAQGSFSSELSKETQRFAQAPGAGERRLRRASPAGGRTDRGALALRRYR